jgi:N-acetyl-anhydromuramyl-L-alanine amidase AmpD
LNQESISLEHAGYAAQTAAIWANPYSNAQLALSASLAADIAKRYSIPAVRLTPAQIVAGGTGFCGHNDITAAFKIAGGHTDPGIFFDWNDYLSMVKSHMLG